MSDDLKERLDALMADTGLRRAEADDARTAVHRAYRAGLRDALKAAMRSDDRRVIGGAGTAADVVKRIDELLIRAKEALA